MKKAMLIKSLVFLGIAASLLAGCAKPVNLCRYDLQYGLVCSPAKATRLQERIRQQGIQVSYFGDNIYVVIPAEKLFYADSSDLIATAPATLNLVAKFLACYQKINLRVVGFSSLYCDKSSNANFAKQRAKIIARELWRRGSDARLVCAGSSSTAKISGNKSWTNRIEIITKRLP